MAADWIKVEHGLPSKPEVMELADTLGVSDNEAVGLLIRFWLWVDVNLSPFCPVVPGTMSRIDRVVGVDGFATSMQSVGWLSINEGEVSIPNYDHHLSQSAKRRGVEARKKRLQRQNVSRSCPDNKGTKQGTREEKRREDIKESTNVDSSASPSRTTPAGSGFVFATLSGQWELPERKLDEYQSTYADRLDVAAEMRKAKQWLADNKGRRKTARGMKSFLTGWLNRAYDRAPLTMDGSRVAAKPSEDTVYNPETGEFVKPLEGK